MAKVEIRFTNEINAMIAKGDKVTLKIYNANYYEYIPYPWLTSYKISKGGKLLFDKWPKTASNIKRTTHQTLNIVQNQQAIIRSEPTLLSSTRFTVDSKYNIS